MTRESPVRIHRYRILNELGIGSMGRVYLAEDPNIGRRLALKVLSQERLSQPEKQAEVHQRFLYEARAAGRLDHPGIVTVYDADSDPLSGDPYLAMEFVEGRSLRSILEHEGPPPIPHTVHLLAQVARALAFAHRHDVIHRDVKPANLLIREHDGVVKVVDFGIAKLVSPALTQPGRLLGTPFYMAPEQLRSQPLDGRADLFSLGVVLYECLSGRVPFEAEHIAGVQLKILQEDPPPLAPFGVPAALEAVVSKALAKDPDQRFPDGDALADALESIGAELPTTTSMPVAGRRRGQGLSTTELPAPDDSLLQTQPASTPTPEATAGVPPPPPPPVPVPPTAQSAPKVPPPPQPVRQPPPTGEHRLGRWGWFGIAGGGLLALFLVGWLAAQLASTARDRDPRRSDAGRIEVQVATAIPGRPPETGLVLPDRAPSRPGARPTSRPPTSSPTSTPPTPAATLPADEAVGQEMGFLHLELRPRLGRARVVVRHADADPDALPLYDGELEAQGALRWRKMSVPPLELPSGVQSLSVQVLNSERDVDAQGSIEVEIVTGVVVSRLLVRPNRKDAEQQLELRSDAPEDEG